MIFSISNHYHQFNISLIATETLYIQLRLKSLLFPHHQIVQTQPLDELAPCQQTLLTFRPNQLQSFTNYSHIQRLIKLYYLAFKRGLIFKITCDEFKSSSHVLQKVLFSNKLANKFLDVIQPYKQPFQMFLSNRLTGSPP